MVPVRALDPIGAIGNYWARRHAPSEEEVRLLQALADTTAVAMENVRVYTELEQRVQQRTAELEAANGDLESFSYSVSHDLRAPVRAIAGFTGLLREDHQDSLDKEAKRKLGVIENEAIRLGSLIDELLEFSRLGRRALERVELDMEKLAQQAFQRQLQEQSRANVELRLGSVLPPAIGDRTLIEQVWANLLSNAVKFSSKKERPVVEIAASSAGGEHIYSVRDNGAGFDPNYQSKLFAVFQRLHHDHEFPGTGVGLALVDRILKRHGGRIWADGNPGEGATFYFALPTEPTP
jgi:hypothetical protein